MLWLDRLNRCPTKVGSEVFRSGVSTRQCVHAHRDLIPVSVSQAEISVLYAVVTGDEISGGIKGTLGGPRQPKDFASGGLTHPNKRALQMQSINSITG